MRENGSSTPVDISTKAYDELSQLITKTDPSAKSESYVHNSLGLSTKTTDRISNVFTYGYDEQNQLTSDKAVNQGNTVSEEYKYCYSSPFGASRIEDLYNNAVRGSVSTTYNAGTGQVTNINGSYTNDSYTPSYTFNYDNAGRIKNMQLAVMEQQTSIHITFTPMTD